MAIHYTNGDRILQAVLADPKLAELGGYISTGDETVLMPLILKMPQYVLLL